MFWILNFFFEFASFIPHNSINTDALVILTFNRFSFVSKSNTVYLSNMSWNSGLTILSVEYNDSVHAVHATVQRSPCLRYPHKLPQFVISIKDKILRLDGLGSRLVFVQINSLFFSSHPECIGSTGLFPSSNNQVGQYTLFKYCINPSTYDIIFPISIFFSQPL